MTNVEWDVCQSPRELLNHLEQTNQKPTHRKAIAIVTAMHHAYVKRNESLYAKQHHEISWNKFNYAIRAFFELGDGRRNLKDEEGLDLTRHMPFCYIPKQPYSYNPHEIISHSVTPLAVDWNHTANLIKDIIGVPYYHVAKTMRGDSCAKCAGRGKYVPDNGWDIAEKCKQCGGIGHEPSPYVTPLVKSIAREIYDTSALNGGVLNNDHLGILADALENEGYPTHEQRRKVNVSIGGKNHEWVVAYCTQVAADQPDDNDKLLRETASIEARSWVSVEGWKIAHITDNLADAKNWADKNLSAELIKSNVVYHDDLHQNLKTRYYGDGLEPERQSTLLYHLRKSDVMHYRGFWALDMVLNFPQFEVTG